MNVYLTGAGASKRIGYPLAAELLQAIDTHIQESTGAAGLLPDKLAWSGVCGWLQRNPDPVIAEAYRNGSLEHLLTSLDLGDKVAIDNINRVAATQGGDGCTLSSTWHAPEIAYLQTTDHYREAREILLQGLEVYLRKKHHDDRVAFKGQEWDYLHQFAQRLNKGDVIITFNYDSSLERVLLSRGMWNPSRGYGFKIELWRSRSDPTPLDFNESSVTVLHLHGALGWYQKEFAYEYHVDPALNTKCVEEPVWLDSAFLEDLGFDAVDPWFIRVSPSTRQLLLYPSFLKSPGVEPGSHALTTQWRMGAEALRKAEMVFIIGYSLPGADTTAAALLIGNCNRQKVEVVNPDDAVNIRIARLLNLDRKPSPRTFEVWLDQTAAAV